MEEDGAIQTSGDRKHEKKQEPTSDYTDDDSGGGLKPHKYVVDCWGGLPLKYVVDSEGGLVPISDLPKDDCSDFEDDDDDDSGPHVITTDDAKLFHEDEHMWSFATKLISLMEVDDSEEFVKTLRHELYTRRVLILSRLEISPLLIFSGTINQLALRCAKTMLSGIATGCPVDVNRTPSKSISLPIHVAAINFLPDFASLLLTYGARLDIPCKNCFCLYRSMLPMDAGFKALSEKISWTPAQSVYGLISSLCNQMELEEAFLTMSHIMTAAPIEQTRKAICNYAGEGKTVELAILLYVDAISGLGILKGFSYDEYLKLCTHVATNITSLPEEELCLAIDGNGVTKSIDELRMAMCSVLLLEIFYKTKFSMLGFSTGHQILAKRINDAGFDLDDDVNAVKRAVKCLKSIDFQQRDLLGTRVGSPKSDREFVLEKRSISSVAAQTFQGSQTIKCRPMSTLCRPMEGQAQVVKGGAHEGWQWHILNSSLGKTCWPVFASAMRRRRSIMLV